MSEAFEDRRCPACGRPVAVVRPRCLYCGAVLSAESVAAARRSAVTIDRGDPPSSPAPDRTLLVLDFAGADPRTVAKALGWTFYEAQQRVRRGAMELLRAFDDPNTSGDLDRYESAGIRVWSVPESEARTALDPLPATGGDPGQAALRLDTPEGDLAVSASDLLLVVRGPIVREYQTSADWRRIRTSTLEPGYRFHLHRRGDTRPVEIDPFAFRFAAPTVPQSSYLRLSSWIETALAAAPSDCAFRYLAPALAPSAVGNDLTSVLSGPLVRRKPEKPTSLPSGRKDQSDPILDNLRQFRFYSGWRGAVARRQPG